MTFMRSFSLALLLALGACGGTLLDTPETCESACGNLHALGCESWDSDCVEMCVAVTSEPGVTLGTRCVARADSCQEADACQQ